MIEKKFVAPFSPNVQADGIHIIELDKDNYPSTYSPDMKKWGDVIKEVYEEMKNGKL